MPDDVETKNAAAPPSAQEINPFSDQVESYLLAKFVTPGPMCASRPRPGVQKPAEFQRKDGLPALGVKRTWVRH